MRTGLALAVCVLLSACGEPGAWQYRKAAALYDQKRYEEAFPLMRKAAEADSTHAMAMLGVMFLFGRGVPADGAAAERWLLLAAERGEVGAQSLVGIMYASGVGVPANADKAKHWLSIAANNGDAEAQALLPQLGRSVQPGTIRFTRP